MYHKPRTFKLEGKCLVGIDNCWSVSTTIEGPIKIENKGKEMDISGGGKMKLSEESGFGRD